MRRPWPVLGCSATKKNIISTNFRAVDYALRCPKRKRLISRQVNTDRRREVNLKWGLLTPTHLQNCCFSASTFIWLERAMKEVWTVLFYDKWIILCFHRTDVCINIKIEWWTKWVRIGYYWWIHRKIWKEFCYNIVVNPRISFVLFSTTLS
jgi:hypothetical protein